MARVRARLNEILVTLPSAGWLAVLFLVPTLIVVAIAFKPTDPLGRGGRGLDP